MKHTLKNTLMSSVAAIAISVGAAGAAQAAQMAMKNDWSGFYAGFNAGYVNYQADGFFNPSEQPGNDIKNGMDGAIVGLHAGFNFQEGDIVFGIEGDVSLTGHKSKTTVHTAGSEDLFIDSDWLGSIRARLGLALENNLLIYATGGLAFTDADVIKCPTCTGSSNQKYDFDLGGVIGLGIAWRATDYISFRAEGFYYFFGNTNLRGDCCGGTGGHADIDPLVFRVGATWHFLHFLK